MKKNNIILIGMPACGKSYFGYKLSEILTDYTFIDTDSLIEKTQGLTIAEIFRNFSEEYFRKLEYETIKMVCTGLHKIISIGGGAFENPDTRSRLLRFGTVYYLKSNIEVLYNRLSDDGSRPLLNCENPKDMLVFTLNKREKNYLKADYVLDETVLAESEIIKFIMESINETNT